jgi:all-trans-retinol 13,14-reductase
MGGMTTAAFLAKLGRRVLVLEQHYVPGGFTHMFSRKGYTWDVGVHAVGEVTPHSLTGRLLRDLTDDKLQWASLGGVCDAFHWPDGFRIDYPDNPTQYRNNLVEAFPDEADAIDDYLRFVREVAGAMKGYYLARTASPRLAPVADRLLGRQAQRYLDMSTADVVSELTDNPKLQAILVSQWGYYGSPPSRSSFAIQALVVKHFLWGGYYPVGGASEIAKHLLQTVADAGGWTRINADVAHIVVENERATGVVLSSGEEIAAGRIISAVGVMSTVERLLPETYREQAWAAGIRKLDPSAAHVCLYLGFKGDIREAGASAANRWFYDTWEMEGQVWDVRPEQEILPRAACLYCSFPSLKDPLHDPGPDQRHTGEVVTFVPWETFAQWKDERWRNRGQAYADFKHKIERQLLDQLLDQMPGLKGMLDFVELSTPVSTHHFVRPIEGSIYGIEPTPERFNNPWLRPKSPIRGLYFSGSEVATVGVIGAMMGGVLASVAAEPIGALRLLRKTHRR